MIIAEGNKYAEEVDAVRRHGALKPAADELRIDIKTLKARVKRAGYRIEAFLVPGTQGKNMTIIRTMLDGSIVRVGKPIPEQINLDDIARGLARTGWNNGQTLGYFSLAHASCLFAEHVARELQSPDATMAALFWQSPAAYMGYVPSFLFDRLHGNFKPLRRQMLMTVQSTFGLKKVAEAQEEALNLEWAIFEKRLDGTMCRGTDELKIIKASSTRNDEAMFKQHYDTLEAVRRLATDIDTCKA